MEPAKTDTEHREREGGKKDLDQEGIVNISDGQGYELLKSKYDELSVGRTLWIFKRVALISIAVYTGYVCEGFEVSLQVHLVAMQGHATLTMSAPAFLVGLGHCQRRLHQAVWRREGQRRAGP